MAGKAKMEDSGAILRQLSCLKDMLDQVNEEIEANIQITREIESEIVKSTEIESTLIVRESELTKKLFLSQFEITGFVSVDGNAKESLRLLKEQLGYLTAERDKMRDGIDREREDFIRQCQEFQREIDGRNKDELVTLLSEKEFLKSEILLWEKKVAALKNSVSAFVEEVLEELHTSIAALDVEIQSGNRENEKLLEDIQEIKRILASTLVIH